MNGTGAVVVRFPPRLAQCIRILPEPLGGWLVVAREHGWLHGDRRAALDDARWLARNHGLPVLHGADERRRR